MQGEKGEMGDDGLFGLPGDPGPEGEKVHKHPVYRVHVYPLTYIARLEFSLSTLWL